MPAGIGTHTTPHPAAAVYAGGPRVDFTAGGGGFGGGAVGFVATGAACGRGASS